MVEAEQGFDVAELGREAQADVGVPSPEKAHRLGEAAREMLDAERVGVAGRLEGRPLGGALGRGGCDAAAPDIVGQSAEDLVDIGIDARDRRPRERAGEVAILAMRRAAFGEVEAPIGRGRDRLEPSLGGRSHDHGQGRFRQTVIGRAALAGREADEPVVGELDDLGPERRGSVAMARPRSQSRAERVTSTRFGRQSRAAVGLGSAVDRGRSTPSRSRPPAHPCPLLLAEQIGCGMRKADQGERRRAAAL